MNLYGGSSGFRGNVDANNGKLSNEYCANAIKTHFQVVWIFLKRIVFVKSVDAKDEETKMANIIGKHEEKKYVAEA